ncbi:Fe-S cluster assembly protein SufD [Azospirillum brasilense]|uniref:Fe-S cluster assembly protein SufD n=1 Tax=Azospirillum brasilense TaxID=192 RepID=A0A235HH16_AZOBR|nr:Fe-S cluster assembly protein SufD [Azospirillum brasilense]OYD85089.1 Fe-S cluster assembly protein SufD [Azospirillum brasilense]
MATTTLTKAPRGYDPAAAKPFLEQFDRVKDGLPGAGLSWLNELRSQGQARFAELGLPTVKNESWRYTNLRALDKLAFQPAAKTGEAVRFDVLPTVRADGATGPRLVFVDGRFRAELSSTAGLPAGVELLNLADALTRKPDLVAEHLGRIAAPDDRTLVALNTAFLADGPVLHVPRGVTVDETIELVFVSVGSEAQPTAFHPRGLIVAEAESRAVIVEHHVGLGSCTTLSNGVTEVFVGEGASVHHYKVQREHAESFHLSHTAAKVAGKGVYDNFILTIGAKLSRNEVNSVLDGEEGDTHVSGAYMVRGGQHVDTTTFIDHAKPCCTSREVYKGVIDDQARAVFQGKIIVRPDAQKTDGYQQNRALLLSDTAEIDAKPELEIYADDVKCSHGATVGELDDDQLFYLRARGIDKAAARGLLIGAFLSEALEEIAEESVRDAFQSYVADWQNAR